MSRRFNYEKLTFSYLTGVKYSHTDKGHAVWIFKCVCGKEISKRGTDIKTKKVTSCGCMRGKAKAKPLIKRFCNCGCGQTFMCKPYSKKQYVNFHQNIGRIASEGKKTKLSSLRKKYYKENCFPEEVKNKISKTLLGNIPWNKGLSMTEEYKRKLSVSHTGFRQSEETKLKRSLLMLGKKHWNWQGGSSYEPYDKNFNSYTKAKVRKRDKFKCKVCGVEEETLNKRLDIHHIDYNKNNSSFSNLISLCHSCHSKTNFSRELWKNQLRESVVTKVEKHG